MTRTILSMTGMMAGMAAAAMPVQAGGFAFNLGIHDGPGGSGGVRVGVRVGDGPIARPCFQPAYRVVQERVWVPTTQTVYEDVPIFGYDGQIVGYRREARVIESGYWTTVERRVLVEPGCGTVAGRGYVQVSSRGRPAPVPPRGYDAHYSDRDRHDRGAPRAGRAPAFRNTLPPSARNPHRSLRNDDRRSAKRG